MRVLIVTLPLPSQSEPNTMAALAHQVRSLERVGVDVEILEIRGIAKLKYLEQWSSLMARASKVDLIHAHFGYCGWLARAQFRKPVVTSFMGDDLLGTPTADGRVQPLSKVIVQINRRLAASMDAVIVKSDEMARVVSPVSAHVVPNGVDLEVFQPMERRKARMLLGWPAGKRYILFPGDPDNPRKDFPLAQVAVAHASQHVDEPLTIVPLKHVGPDRVPLFMNACDAMVMTSYIEGSPNVVKEAMACNLPVISVPVGDVASLLSNVEGYSIVPRDGAALGRALTGLLASDRRIDGRGALIERGLDVITVARRIVAIYTRVLEHTRGRAARSETASMDIGGSVC